MDLPLRLGDEAAHVPAADVAGHHDPALTPFSGNRGRSFDDPQGRQPFQRNPLARCCDDRHTSDIGHALPQVLRQADGQRKAELPFDNFAQRLRAQRFDQIQDRLGRHAVAGDFILLDLDLQHRLTGDLLHVHIRRAPNLLEPFLGDHGLRFQHFEVVAEQFQPQVRTDAGDHFICPLLDGLRDGVTLAGQGAKLSIHKQNQLVLRARLFPLRTRLQADEQVGQLDTHRVGGHFGGADTTPDVSNLVGEGGQDRFFHLRVGLDRLVEVGARQADNAEDKRSLRQPWHKFRA